MRSIGSVPRLLAGLVAGCLLVPVGAQVASASPPTARAAVGTAATGGPGHGRWVGMAPAGLPEADDVTGAWTGRELVVVGVRHRDDAVGTTFAAAYDPRGNRWRHLPAPRAHQDSRISRELRSVWTGRELFVWGSVHAAYDPARGRWRPLPEPAQPFGWDGYALAWTGRAVIAWGGGCCASNERTGSAYDPVTDRWTSLPPSPLSARDTAGVWTGRELVLVGGYARGGPEYRDVASYDPRTGRWRRLAPLPAARGDARLAWTGREILAIGGAIGAPGSRAQFAYSPATNRWRTIVAPVPDASLTTTWTGRQLLVWGEGKAVGDRVLPGRGVGYTPSTGAWTPMPRAPLSGRLGAVTAWTGRELLVWGGAGANDGARFRP